MSSFLTEKEEALHLAVKFYLFSFSGASDTYFPVKQQISGNNCNSSHDKLGLTIRGSRHIVKPVFFSTDPCSPHHQPSTPQVSSLNQSQHVPLRIGEGADENKFSDERFHGRIFQFHTSKNPVINRLVRPKMPLRATGFAPHHCCQRLRDISHPWLK